MPKNLPTKKIAKFEIPQNYSFKGIEYEKKKTLSKL